MRVQLIKEFIANGTTWYSIYKDNSYVLGTLTKNFSEAVENYNKVIATEPTRELITEQEIEY